MKSVPRLSAFYGMVVYVYHWRDHAPPHFHVEYGDREALIVIADGRVYAGSLPTRALRMVRQWRRLHLAELQEAWERASRPPNRSREALLAEVRRGAARRRIVATFTTMAAAAAIAVPLAFTSGGRTTVRVLPPAPSESSSTVETPTTTAESTDTSPSTTGDASASSPVPTGFVIESFSAISTTQWWVLGSVPCGTQLCSEIAVTTDGGASFKILLAPGGPFSEPPAGPPISSIRFADPNDGWVFGPDLYATHDGGHHWAAIHLGGQVVRALEAGSDQVFAIIGPPTTSCASSGTCNATTPAPHLWRTSPTGDGWRVDTAAGDVSEGLAVHGQSVWV
jgi:hypothetical protein